MPRANRFCLLALHDGYPSRVSSEDRTNTLEGINAPGDPATERVIRNRGAFYGFTTIVICLILGLALIGTATDLDTFGVSSDHVRDSGEGYELDVTYAAVSRPGLTSPFVIEVKRAGGFSDPITLAVDREHFEMWDENGRNPAPSAEAMHGDWLMWEFDPPTGETFRFTLDARISPTVQSGRDGRVAVMEANVPVVDVDFYTRIMP